MSAVLRRAWCVILVFVLSHGWIVPVFADDPSSNTTSTTEVEPLDPSGSSSTTELFSPDSTSTEDLIKLVHPTDAPSTEFLPVASSTEPALSSSTVSLISSDSVPSSTLLTTSTIIASLFQPLLDLISPAPLQGPEWIQFRGIDATSASLLIGWHLEDSDSSIFVFTSSTHFLHDPNTNALRIELKSSRLNNSGDRVALIRPDGTIVDETTYPSMQHDQRWARDGNSWKRVPEPITVLIPAPTPPPPIISLTPTSSTSLPDSSITSSTIQTSLPVTATTNNLVTSTQPALIIDESAIEPIIPIIIEEHVPAATVVSSKPKKPTAIKKTPSIKSIKTASPRTPIPKEDKITITNATIPIAKPIKPKTSNKKAASTKKTAPSKKKATLSKVAPAILIDDFSMLSPLPSTRVRITGVVGSTPRLISKNLFVLLNPDGKGLLVHKLSNQTSPPYQSTISLTGTITNNDEGISLHMAKKDSWSQEVSSTEETTPEPRPVNLVAPSQEDAWSLIQVEGMVKEVASTRITIDLEDGGVLRVSLKQALGYRATRLHKGDRVRVQGLLDTRSDLPVLLPQTPETIELVQEALTAHPTNPPTADQVPWVPFGAAGTSVALTHGYHWLKKRKKNGDLEEKAQLIQERLLE